MQILKWTHLGCSLRSTENREEVISCKRWSIHYGSTASVQGKEAVTTGSNKLSRNAFRQGSVFRKQSVFACRNAYKRVCGCSSSQEMSFLLVSFGSEHSGVQSCREVSQAWEVAGACWRWGDTILPRCFWSYIPPNLMLSPPPYYCWFYWDLIKWYHSVHIVFSSKRRYSNATCPPDM